MPLTPQQITRLAEAIEEQWDLATFQLFVSDKLDLRFDPGAYTGSAKDRYGNFVADLIKTRPRRDAEFLEKLRYHGNAALRTLADSLLRPNFLSPTGYARDAVALGSQPFADRGDLRDSLEEFIAPSLHTTRVLVIRGIGPCGKSYSWPFLQHLANANGAQAQHLPLGDAKYTPRTFIEAIFDLLRLDRKYLPPMTDDPPPTQMVPMINVFKGLIPDLTKAFWLVIDDLNDDDVTPEVREAAYAVARAVEKVKPDSLWVVLLGYNTAITDDDLRRAATDDAQFPGAAHFADYFSQMAMGSPEPLAMAEAQMYAERLFERYPPRTKEAMIRLTRHIEIAGEKFRQGERPKENGHESEK